MTETASPRQPVAATTSRDTMVAVRPTPLADDQSKPFWDACAERRLVAQRCSHCGRWRFPPRPTCPRCRSFEHRWEDLAGTGRIWSWIRAHPPLLPAFAAIAPYVAIVVELDEDPIHLRMVGRLADDAEVAIGDPVVVDFEPVSDVFLPVWRRP